MKSEEILVKRLTEKGLKIATAESCTGGLISKRITDVSGSSGVFECTVVSYSDRIKHEILGVDADVLESFGAVSEETARQMVRGILKLTSADIGVAVTGIAGPNSDGTDKPVGLVYIAVSDGKKTIVKKYLNSFTDNIRENNRNKTADEAINLVLENFI
ncbi:MAG: CinA family protein [Ruminococcaceae bacterium]|nr:CinA family protein [Oscillospiraceae bacterium]